MKTVNPIVDSLLTDKYQLTMSYSYWKSQKHNQEAVFDLFFRRNPFGGEFTVFAGLEEVLKYIINFRFDERKIEFLKDGRLVPKEDLQAEFEYGLSSGYIRETAGGYEELKLGRSGNDYWEKTKYPTKDVYIDPPLDGCDSRFFDWLKSIDCSTIKLYSFPEGTIVFPREPVIRVEGPIAIAQLLETTLLNLTNFPSLISTNAARHRLAAGFNKTMIEFGLRRAQGPDGALSASHYIYNSGFDGTSNMKAGEIFGIPMMGTHAHSLVQSFKGLDDLTDRDLVGKDGKVHDFISLVLKIRNEFGFNETNEGELAAFIAYAQAFPGNFLALVDTYDTLKSGVPNFLCVAVALMRLGYTPIGIRLDSGDLAYLSRESRKMFKRAGKKLAIDVSFFRITASNDINEDVIVALEKQGHEIDAFGIGTHLVTCQAQPALGFVYKLVMIMDNPRIKLSQDVGKVTIPAKKEVYRLIGNENKPIIDLMIQVGETPPKVGERIFCRHPFEEAKRVNVIPKQIIPLHKLVWDGKMKYPPARNSEIRNYVIQQLTNFRSDHLRHLNPTPYKVAVSQGLYEYIHGLWMKEAPITTLT
ncbi:MAG: nicotinate phosphoribosyltransferase 2 [Deltaproteobacteria bacterium]|jgi:nicotinate phosphoribosyltransferase|nr:nicotinate phosphoribosyltransferase 2 [Deltaproteobacteria bacterium]